VVRHEHERWDGNGYPDGLAGTEIPIASRIILACDAYNAMITTRPYREAMSAEDAVAELRDKSGTQFDPQVVAALLRRLRVPALSPSASAASAS
jgi:HD-GYP domain-containing protein (c-di-GMP phosphodiesterase class II)